MHVVPTVVALTAVTAAFAASLSAQHPIRCATPQDIPSQNVQLRGGPADCSANQTNPLQQYAPSFTYRIPVVFHVISNTSGTGNLSDALVRSQIDILNEDTLAISGTNGAPGTDCRIEFYLATIDPEGNPTTGITRSANNTWFNDSGRYWNTLAWDPNRYLNIYSNRAGGALGYVPFLPQTGSVGSKSDRVVVLYSTVGRNGSYGAPYNQGRTVTHEIGHYLGLYHTFQGGCGGSNCYTSGDRICDTEGERSATFGCPRNKSACSSPDPIHNYMDYSDDLCMWEFAPEQAKRMRCTLENYRPNVWTTTNAAFVAFRTGGDNPASYAAQRPVLGTTITLTVDTSTTGHTMAGVYGFSASARQLFAGNVLLIDVAAPPGELLAVPTASGPLAQMQFPVPNDNTLTGLTVYTQAVHFGGASGFALSNAQDLTFGPN